MLTFKFSSFPTLETKRLLLRQVIESDAESVFRLRNDPKTVEYTARPPYASLGEAVEMVNTMQESYDNSDGISWAITIKGENKMIGGIGFWRFIREHYRAEIGYSLLPEHWNQGLMTEAIEAIVAFGFEHIGLHSIEANLNPNNKGSIRVLEKTGFEKEGYFKENYYFNGQFDDTLTFGKIKPRL